MIFAIALNANNADPIAFKIRHCFKMKVHFGEFLQLMNMWLEQQHLRKPHTIFFFLIHTELDIFSQKADWNQG